MTKTSSKTTAARAAAKLNKQKKPAGETKLDKLATLLRRPNGATIAELMKATGWQQHSVRGALAGTLRKKGYSISSEMVGDVRRYRIVETAA